MEWKHKGYNYLYISLLLKGILYDTTYNLFRSVFKSREIISLTLEFGQRAMFIPSAFNMLIHKDIPGKSQIASTEPFNK
jgi:hypothetical protein